MDMKSLLEKMSQLSQVDEATKKKPDFLDKDGDGNTTEPMKKAVADADKDDKEKVEEAIAIQADGQEAMALLDMLKLAGQPAPQQQTPDVVVGGCGMTEADRAIKHVNTPDEKIADMSAATPKGNDLHGGQSGYRAAAGGDNPMVAAMEGKLKKMFESLSKE